MSARSSRIAGWLASVVLVLPLCASAMGLRAFVALPVDKGGTVARMQLLRNDDTDVDVGVLNLAYGIGARQALLLGLPYRLAPAGGGRRFGDLGLLYRYIVRQSDNPDGTMRIGLLAGASVPTNGDRDPGGQVGVVGTWYRGRHELDADLLWQPGFGNRGDAARYDLSWQYRLSPAEYPEWGSGNEWNGVVELNGRWNEAGVVTHQLTLGLQWIHPRWVLEGGVYRDLNGPKQTHFLLSARVHF